MLSPKATQLRARGLPVLLLAAVSLAVVACTVRSADNERDDPLETWLQTRALVIGLNREARVFAVRAAGRDRLECLVWAIGRFSEWLQSEVSVGEGGGNGGGKTSTTWSSNRLMGYEIAVESINRKGDGIENIVVILKNDRLVCMAHHTRLRGRPASHTRAFFPTFDEAGRAKLEDQLASTFVKDSLAHRPRDGEPMECIFLIDCHPAARAQE